MFFHWGMIMQTMTRRQLLRAAGAGAMALAVAPLRAQEGQVKKEGFTLPPLPYPYDALEPHIDAETMKIHHDKHHAAYVANLNKALQPHPELLNKPIDVLLREIASVPMNIRQAVINNGGGHYNHSLFWLVMAKKGGGRPSGQLGQAIDSAFGSFDKFQDAFSQAGITRFGSGWAWLVVGPDKLEIVSSANQDSPILPQMKGRTPILGLDVWEHAYYLKYQNRRPDYVKAWWNVVNWDGVAERYAKAHKR
jgi:Fe-Mn family superoxide dismutase